MTERLYYTDPYLREFDARVVRVDDVDGQRSIVLDRTAFYPTSGGQPFDVGRLGDLRVDRRRRGRRRFAASRARTWR